MTPEPTTSTPGTIPSPGTPIGRRGAGETIATIFSIPAGSIGEALKIPACFEPQRSLIESKVSPIILWKSEGVLL